MNGASVSHSADDFNHFFLNIPHEIVGRRYSNVVNPVSFLKDITTSPFEFEPIC